MTDRKYAAAYPHDPIEALFPSVYWAHGSIKMGSGLSMNRNMIILKSGSELSLVNPIRLSTAEENKLCALGQIKNIIRLGDFHGLDDQYYIDKFNAEFWCQKGQTTYQTPMPDYIIEEGVRPPIEDTEFFQFSTAIYPEAALLVKSVALLITTDSIQNHTDWSHTTWLTKIVLKLMGFKKALLIGKPWIKRVTPKGQSMEGDFDKLLTLEFDHIIGAHGTLFRGNAKSALKQVVDNTFSPAR